MDRQLVAKLDDNVSIYDFAGRDLTKLSEMEMLQFCKANKTFGEPGISGDELAALHIAAQSLGDRPIVSVETGICYGTTTRYFTLRSMRNGGRHHAFEIWVRDDFKKAMQDLDLWKKFDIHGHSIKDNWQGNIDFLYIDSEHALQDALGEYMRFRVWLNDNSIVGFHDVDMCPGVAKALEMIQEVDDLELISSSLNNLAAGIVFFKVRKMNRYDRPWQKGYKWQP